MNIEFYLNPTHPFTRIDIPSESEPFLVCNGIEHADNLLDLNFGKLVLKNVVFNLILMLWSLMVFVIIVTWVLIQAFTHAGKTNDPRICSS